jgi:hypothetical protein
MAWCLGFLPDRTASSTPSWAAEPPRGLREPRPQVHRIEIEERYFDIACRRIKDAYAQRGCSRTSRPSRCSWSWGSGDGLSIQLPVERAGRVRRAVRPWSRLRHGGALARVLVLRAMKQYPLSGRQKARAEESHGRAPSLARECSEQHSGQRGGRLRVWLKSSSRRLAHRYENNRTRELRKLDWVPMSNRHDGDGYTELMDHQNGAAHFGLVRDGRGGVPVHPAGILCRTTGPSRRPNPRPDDPDPRRSVERRIAKIRSDWLDKMEKCPENPRGVRR